MKVSVIMGHPNKKSFNYAIAEAVVSQLTGLGHEVLFHDLYEEGFEAVMTGYELVNGVSKDALIEQHCKEIEEAEGIIIIHPNWWGQPPAILKGWVDRVLRMGLAYDERKDDKGVSSPIGLLKTKVAIVFNTSNTPEQHEVEVLKDPLETIWKNCIFSFCGVKNFHRKMFRIIESSTLEERKGWLKEAEAMVNEHFALIDKKQMINGDE